VEKSSKTMFYSNINISNLMIPLFFLEFLKISQFSPRKEVSMPGEQFWDGFTGRVQAGQPRGDQVQVQPID
jgi:hypothetical protein